MTHSKTAPEILSSTLACTTIDDEGKEISIPQNFLLQWGVKGFGFGELYFYVDKADGKMHCHNEFLSKDNIKDLLCKMVDDCILNDNHDDTDGY